MAEPYEYVTSLLVTLLPCAAGVQIARWLVPEERRLLVVGGLGAGLGVGLVTFGISALVQVMPLLAAAILVNATSAVLTGWLVWQWRRDPLRLDLGRWAWLIGALLLLVLFVAGVEYTASVWYASGAGENLFIRLVLAGHFVAGSWPPVNPWEPDTVWFYRFGGPLWMAAVALTAGADVFAAGLTVTLVAVLVFLWGGAAAVILLSDRATGLLAALLAAVAGPQNFLGLFKAPFDELTVSSAAALTASRDVLMEGYVLARPFERLIASSNAEVVALAAFGGVSALAVAMGRQRARPVPSILVGGAALAGMNVTAEHLGPVLAAVMALSIVWLIVVRRFGPSVMLTAMLVAAAGLTLIPESPLATVVRGEEAPTARSFLRLDTEDLFTLPTTGPHGGRTIFASDDPPRLGLLAPLMWKQYGWALIALAGSTTIAAVRRRPALAIPAALVVVALLIPGVLHDDLNPQNPGRFARLGLLLAPAALAIVLMELWRWRWAGRRVVRLGAVGLALLAAGTWIVTLGLHPAAVYRHRSPVLSDELAAASFAAELSYPQRAVLLPGPRDFSEIQGDFSDAMHQYAVAFGRLRVPMGFDNRGEWERYAPRYAQAQETLAPEVLADLRIDLIYTAQDQLTPEQAQVLAAALERGTITPLFVSPNGVRVIYQVETGRPG